MIKRIITITTLCVLFTDMTLAQQDNGIILSGNIQSDVLIPQGEDSYANKKDESLMTNTYAELIAMSQHVDAGLRLEYTEHSLPGFENDFNGFGIPHFWVKGRLGNSFELVLGTFYEQFGSGFILRTYQDRTLGIDNSIMGARIHATPLQGLSAKALTGKQRRYWEWNNALISGFDVEFNFDQYLEILQKRSIYLMLGGSWVNKYDDEENKVYITPLYRIRFPKFVNTWDIRVNLNKGPWNFLVEYAHKGADPSYANNYIFRKGMAAMFSGSYSNNGFSLLFQTKRSENMSFKSTNNPSKSIGISSTINHLPAFTPDHSYTLAALYPYSTQITDGEWAYQAELGYNFKRNTKLGGPYGMSLKVNYSYIRAIDRIPYNDDDLIQSTNGYTSSFFKWGDQTYYKDFNVSIDRKFSKAFKLNLIYMNQLYNKTIVEGDGGIVHSNIFIADGKYQFTPKMTLRGELQYLSTRDDQLDWTYCLMELSVATHWMFTVSDLWNCGETDTHYVQGCVTFNYGQHRIQGGYGSTRAGYNCSGGVCRYVPATKGFTLSYNYIF